MKDRYSLLELFNIAGMAMRRAAIDGGLHWKDLAAPPRLTLPHRKRALRARREAALAMLTNAGRNGLRSKGIDPSSPAAEHAIQTAVLAMRRAVPPAKLLATKKSVARKVLHLWGHPETRKYLLKRRDSRTYFGNMRSIVEDHHSRRLTCERRVDDRLRQHSRNRRSPGASATRRAGSRRTPSRSSGGGSSGSDDGEGGSEPPPCRRQAEEPNTISIGVQA